MAKISVQTAHKRAITRTVVSSLQSNMDSLVDALVPVLSAQESKVSPSAVKAVISALAGLLDRDYQAVENADRELARERGEDADKRSARDEHVAALREQIETLRDAVSSIYGESGVKACGLSGNTPRSADGLITHARNVATKVIALPEPKKAGFVTMDSGKVVAELSETTDALDQAAKSLEQDTRETQTAQVVRDDAEEAWRVHYSAVAAIAEQLYRIADMAEHAERVRPTARRRAGNPEPPDLEPAPADPSAPAPAEP